MLYKPSKGKFKDNCMFYYKGRFYLYSMYDKRETSYASYKSVWLTVSDDGVHWIEKGIVIDAPFEIWAMNVYAVGDTFYMNSGSFVNNDFSRSMLRFWKSDDLENWEYLPELDIISKEYKSGVFARIDCMRVLYEKGLYYGYVTGHNGFLISPDGQHWDYKNTMIDFEELPSFKTEFGGFEISACEKVNGKYYYIGGAFGYMGKTGYGCYVFTSDSPGGPFKPDVEAFILSGNSKRWVYIWACLCRVGNEILCNSYMQEGYSYECGNTWLPLLKKADTDRHHHLRLYYWNGNDLLKGSKILPGGKNYDTLLLDFNNKTKQVLESDSENYIRQPELLSIFDNKTILSIKKMPYDFENEKGVVIEGEIRFSEDTWIHFPCGGFYLEETEGTGTVILFDNIGKTIINSVGYNGDYYFTEEDEIDCCYAMPSIISLNDWHSFKIFIRFNMYEIYIDDRYVQTLNTSKENKPTGNPVTGFGYVSKNCKCEFKNTEVYKMNI